MRMEDRAVLGVGVLTAVCIDRQDEDGGLTRSKRIGLKSNYPLLLRLSIGTVAVSKGNVQVAGCVSLGFESIV